MPPFFTIITATYNAATTLPRLLASLAEQTCRDFELIIQDGASTDNTVGIVEEWRDKLPALSLESAKDTGIYDAWNKALPRIRGQWVLFLGADDLLAGPAVLGEAKSYLVSYAETVLLAGGAAECFETLNEPIFTTYNDKKLIFEQRKLRIPFSHPALFARSALFATHKFDANYAIAGDYDWIIRVAKDISHVSILPLVVACYALGGISSSTLHQLRCEMEVLKIRAKYFPIYFIKSLPSVFFVYFDRRLLVIKLYLKPYMLRNEFFSNMWQALKKMRRYLSNGAF